jgi:hypothetical protein
MLLPLPLPLLVLLLRPLPALPLFPARPNPGGCARPNRGKNDAGALTDEEPLWPPGDIVVAVAAALEVVMMVAAAVVGGAVAAWWPSSSPLLDCVNPLTSLSIDEDRPLDFPSACNSNAPALLFPLLGIGFAHSDERPPETAGMAFVSAAEDHMVEG